MGEEAELCLCIQNICDLVALEAAAIISQGYINDRKFRNIDKDSIYKLLSSNDNLNYMKVTRHQNLRSLRAWTQDQYTSNIDIALLMDDILENQCDNLCVERYTGGKGYPYKSQDKPFLWDRHIFKIGVYTEKNYVWLGLNNNSRRVPLERLTILTGTSTGVDGYLLEGTYFDAYKWSAMYFHQSHVWAPMKL